MNDIVRPLIMMCALIGGGNAMAELICIVLVSVYVIQMSQRGKRAVEKIKVIDSIRKGSKAFVDELKEELEKPDEENAIVECGCVNVNDPYHRCGEFCVHVGVSVQQPNGQNLFSKLTCFRRRRRWRPLPIRSWRRPP